jgi:hypothetical protein
MTMPIIEKMPVTNAIRLLKQFTTEFCGAFDILLIKSWVLGFSKQAYSMRLSFPITIGTKFLVKLRVIETPISVPKYSLLRANITAKNDAKIHNPTTHTDKFPDMNPDALSTRFLVICIDSAAKPDDRNISTNVSSAGTFAYRHMIIIDSKPLRMATPN